MNMAKIMMAITPLISAGGDKAKMKNAVGKLVNEFATQDNINKAASAMIQGLADLQKKTGKQYVITAEGSIGNITIGIYHRNEESRLELIREIYLRDITQSDVHTLVNMIFNAGQ